MKIYRFGNGIHVDLDSPVDWVSVLGGKGYGLHRMVQAGMPVPPGLVIPTDVSLKMLKLPSDAIRAGYMNTKIMPVVLGAYIALESDLGHRPLVSVRSGAPVSMPGMMDTILNVGISRSNLKYHAKYMGGMKVALDSYRRLIHMLGSTAFDVPHHKFEEAIATAKKSAKVENDSQLSEARLKTLVTRYEKLFKKHVGFDFPQEVEVQLALAISAVFDSWNSDRAKYYRSMNSIPETMGTAVNIQCMVFGNRNVDSGTGVFFTRNPNSGENAMYGDYLVEAQGEDVVAGVRTPLPLETMISSGGIWPRISDELFEISLKLEVLYQDMVDGEFTVENGKLWMLQSRKGKRTPTAAIVIAEDMLDEELISIDELTKVLTTEQFLKAKVVYVDDDKAPIPDCMGVAASLGVVSGVACMSSTKALESIVPCILVSNETTPEDIAGMDAAIGVLTYTGGTTSHAAVVARSMNKPCVVGIGADTLMISDGDVLTICGATGRVWVNTKVPVREGVPKSVIARLANRIAKSKNTPVLVDADTDYSVCNANGVLSIVAVGARKFTNMVQDLPGGGIVLDFRTAEELVPAADLGFMSAMCRGANNGVLGKKKYTKNVLTKFGVSGRRVILGDSVAVDSFLKVGCTISGKAMNVRELISNPDMYMDSGEIDRVFGDTDTMSSVMKAMGVATNMFTSPQTYDMLVLSALQAKE